MFNLSKFFGGETVPKPNQKRDEESFEPVVVEEKKALDPDLLTISFTKQEVQNFKNKGMSDKEIELLKKIALNNLQRARFDNSN